MAKEEDDKRVGATNNASARAGVKTRAAARTKASGAMAKSNEGEVAEAPKYDSAEVILLGAKSFDSVIQIHSEYAKTSYESFVAQAKKMGELYSDLAKEFFKPIETAITKVQTFNANDARKSGLLWTAMLGSIPRTLLKLFASILRSLKTLRRVGQRHLTVAKY